MLSFVQANRTSRSDNELLGRAIKGEGALDFEFPKADAQAIISTFEPNYRRQSNQPTLFQRYRIFFGNLWNSSYGNVVRFILHMGPLNVNLSIEEDDEAGEFVLRVVPTNRDA